MIPAPGDYVARALVLEGALVEAVPAGFEAILPEPLAHELGVPESIHLAQAAGDEGVPCGLGTPLLERLVAAARARVPIASARIGGAPRLGHARSLAERLVLRNGVASVVDATASEGVYLEAWFAWSAEADDRFEGVVHVVVDPMTGGEPDAGFCRALELELLEPWPSERASERIVADDGAHWLGRRVPAIIEPRLASIRDGIERRHARDHRRIEGYFADLAREAGSTRRRIERDALAAKIEHLANERDGKLAELRERYALRVDWRLATARWVLAPRATVRLRLRRRKAERDLALHLPPFAAALDRPACDGCGGPLDALAVCDERLHGLCERCAPSAQGRLRCPACGG